MRKAEVEIYSDRTNAAILRHPDRHYPGVLIQGDTLSSLCKDADLACKQCDKSSPAYALLNDVRNRLQSYLAHYKITLDAHEIKLPFYDDYSK
jgi:hypothetical protein